ncbi:unnamed protein product [Mytilus coruscus]|uniref:Uncharacterized protein n=1 Tax=Mytilus coruscus TaxID=42192 RepID=A0A6J8E991_MYTCO|nr:unnamed protein product [Mytilus coruscus]
MGHTKKGFVSVLMQKDLEKMEKLNWNEIVNEFLHKFPTVFKLIIGIMLPESENYKQLISCLSRIGLLYSLILQARHPGLSLIQRTVSMLLMDNICDQKVYDRLQAIGVTLSYQKSLYVLDILEGSFNTAAIEAVTNKKTLRIIGDNVNFKTSITEQHNSNDGKTFEMHHAFASALLVDAKVERVTQTEETIKLRQIYVNDNTAEVKITTEHKNQSNDHQIILHEVTKALEVVKKKKTDEHKKQDKKLAFGLCVLKMPMPKEVLFPRANFPSLRTVVPRSSFFSFMDLQPVIKIADEVIIDEDEIVEVEPFIGDKLYDS